MVLADKDGIWLGCNGKKKIRIADGTPPTKHRFNTAIREMVLADKDGIWVGCNGKKKIKVPTGPVYEILRQVRIHFQSKLLVNYSKLLVNHSKLLVNHL